MGNSPWSPILSWNVVIDAGLPTFETLSLNPNSLSTYLLSLSLFCRFSFLFFFSLLLLSSISLTHSSYLLFSFSFSLFVYICLSPFFFLLHQVAVSRETNWTLSWMMTMRSWPFDTNYTVWRKCCHAGLLGFVACVHDLTRRSPEIIRKPMKSESSLNTIFLVPPSPRSGKLTTRSSQISSRRATSFVFVFLYFCFVSITTDAFGHVFRNKQK